VTIGWLGGALFGGVPVLGIVWAHAEQQASSINVNKRKQRRIGGLLCTGRGSAR
jgi:hypothetical protein